MVVLDRTWRVRLAVSTGVLLLLVAGAASNSPAARAEAAAAAGLRRALSARLDAGGAHTCAIRDDGKVVCWGLNSDAQLGTGDIVSRGDDPDELPAPTVALGPGRTARAITAGDRFTCALRDDGSVVCWGLNTDGQLGVGDIAERGDVAGELPAPAVPLGLGRTAAAITAGDRHACALRDNGSVVCWGYNIQGQLGAGDATTRGDNAAELPAPEVLIGTGRTATAISAGANHTCALRDDGSVVCWGYNFNGQLGVGSTAHRGDQANETLAPVPIDGSAVAIAAGDDHTCALRVDGAVLCWGFNENGQLGIGDIVTRGDDLGDVLLPVPLGPGRTAIAITGGAAHSCAARDDGSVVCWGENQYGQLGAGETFDRGDEPEELPAEPVQLGEGRSAGAITGGKYHACAVRDDGTVGCWGNNSSGQLGAGDDDHRGDATGEIASAVALGGKVRTPALSVGNVAVAEGTGDTQELTFAITRISVFGSVRVNYATVAGSAAASTDYTTTTGQLTLAHGVMSATVAVPVRTDADREPTETVTLHLSAARGATIADADGTGSITNDDAQPELSIGDAVIVERDSGSRSVSLRVRLDHRSFEQVTLSYRTVDGSATAPSDYGARNGTLTIAPYALSGRITIPVRGDVTNEPDETFHLGATRATKATVADPVGTVILFDDD